jgi:glucan 1,6-alpha-glucosidase
MLATMLHGMEGTPYIFQGEELGMTNIRLPIEEHVDLETLNVYRERLEKGYDPEAVMASIHARSRDNARTPMQWTAGENAGFTTGKPWVPVNPNYVEVNAAAALADENSVFHYYRKLIELRKTYDVFRRGSFTLLYPEDEKIFAYSRDTEQEHLLVVCNFTDETLCLDAPENFRGSEMLLSNYTEDSDFLRPYETVILYYRDNA